MTEEEELVEETEVFVTQGNNALIELLEKRIDLIKGSIQLVAFDRQDAARDYLRRLEHKYYAALQRKGVIGVAR